MNQYTIIITHFISDWWLQSRVSAENKTSSLGWMIVHVGTIFLSFFVVSLALYGCCEVDSPSQKLFLHYVWMCALNAIAHFFIDASVWGYFKGYVGRMTEISEDYVKYNRYAKDYWFYFTIGLDQMLHLCVALYLFKPI